jgi:hypothetical protein
MTRDCRECGVLLTDTNWQPSRKLRGDYICRPCRRGPQVGPQFVKLCECLGKCGLPTPIAKVTNPRRGHVKGQPMRLIKGHQNRRDLTERIRKDVDRTTAPDGCHEWTRYRDKGGYGTMKVNGRTRKVTHIILERAGFMIPARGLDALHRCDNPPCCRYAHLKIGPQKENSEDMVARGRQARGERQDAAKLKNGYATATEIRRLFAAGGISKAALGRRYGVSATNIKHIINGETWNR